MSAQPTAEALKAANEVYPKALAVGTHLAMFGDDDAETAAARLKAITGLAAVIDSATNLPALLAERTALREQLETLVRLLERGRIKLPMSNRMLPDADQQIYIENARAVLATKPNQETKA